MEPQESPRSQTEGEEAIQDRGTSKGVPLRDDRKDPDRRREDVHEATVDGERAPEQYQRHYGCSALRYLRRPRVPVPDPHATSGKVWVVSQDVHNL